MVRGIELFKEHFAGHAANYVLIGGTACDLAMSAVGEEFRATKDLDIVLCLESMDPDFVNTFWAFVKAGGYETREKSTGKKLFYRFHSPADKAYPFMLELFSRIPDALHYEGGGRLTPIPMEEEASSLSAILLDDSYYAFLHEGKTGIEGVSVVRPEYILPLKAKAWLDLTSRKAAGKQVPGQNIRKHRADILRLFRILTPAATPRLTGQVAEDFRAFIETVTGENLQMASFGYNRGISFDTIIKQIGDAYGIAG